MSNIFLCSDHHLSHSNLLTFKRGDGVTPLRVFNSIEEHDEYIISQHNAVVSDKDRVYFLGDLVFSKKHIHLVGRMRGRKVLIKGNHDKLELKEYLPYFDDIRGSHQFDGMLLTHIPVHTESLGRWPINVHGHLHANKVKKDVIAEDRGTFKIDDPRYFSVCMEQLEDYTPISLEALKQKAKFRLEMAF